MLEIVTAPNSVLSQKAKKVKKIDAAISNLIKEMNETLLAAKDPKGVGLAAPQVGKSLSIFQVKPSEKFPVATFINPVIENTESVKEIPTLSNSQKIEAKKPKASKGKLLEGCLSIPNIWGNVSRAKKITVSWRDEKNKHHRKIFDGFSAIIIQHEMDHLDGILFPKRVLEQKGKLYKSQKNEKNEDVFEEIEI
ncbi:peptide deformylase [Candidatus Roizmanbacteria bacterium]|nr:peptide deformylase [Candidatus Roizmanbacteria bacterium]